MINNDISLGELSSNGENNGSNTANLLVELQKLRHENLLLKSLIQNLPGEVSIINKNGEIMFSNNLHFDCQAKVQDSMQYFTDTNSIVGLDNAECFVDIESTKEWEVISNDEFNKKHNVIYRLKKIKEVGLDEYWLKCAVDVTEYKQSINKLEKYQQLYADLFNYSQAWVCTHDLNGYLLSINPSACAMLGYREKELIGKNIKDLISDKASLNFQSDYLDPLIKTGTSTGLLKFYNRNGDKIYLLYSNYVRHDENREPYIVGLAQNVTDRLYAEQALLHSEEKYRNIIENMNLGMFEIDLNDNIRYANQRVCSMIGYTVAELFGKNLLELLLDDGSKKDRFEQLRKKQFSDSNNYEFLVRTKGEKNVWWLISTAPSLDSEGELLGSIIICLDITRQKNMELELREAILDAEHSSKAKEAFLANMSHEIRTPINAITGLGKLLSKTTLNKQQQFYLNSIRTASENLLVIIDDILDISKIEAGKIQIEHIPLDLKKIVEHAVNILKPRAEEKILDLSFSYDSNVDSNLLGDPYRINQVLVNMLSNAIKFTEKGSVNLTVQLVEDENNIQYVHIDIIDTGIGISEDFIKRIFSKFTQEDETVVRKFGGTGLGMSITKQLMELMGGEVEIYSQKNVGTKVSLMFRFEKCNKYIMHKQEVIMTDTSVLANSKILLVEDNDLNRLLAYTILSQYGAFVVSAANGAIAVSEARNNRFDIILMDVQMPVMDGVTATNAIREFDKDVPIIALTADAIKGKKDIYINKGMNDYLTKPYEEETMISLLAHWLNNRSANLLPHINEESTNKDNTVLEEPIYDLTKLIAIGGDNPEFVNNMLSLFVSDVPQSMKQIKEAYMSRDFKTIKYLAHRIRPSLLNMGINSLKNESVLLEKMAEKQLVGTEMESIIEKMITTVNLVSAKIKSQYNV